jgi:hypothetical protein
MRELTRRFMAIPAAAVAVFLAGACLVCLASGVSADVSDSPLQGSAKVDTTGKWVFTVQTDAGSGTPAVTLKQEGEKLTGHYSSQNFGEVDLTGTVKGQEIKFSFTSDVQGTQLQVNYSGTIENKDSMKGTVDIGGLAQGTFTAKRQ